MIADPIVYKKQEGAGSRETYLQGGVVAEQKDHNLEALPQERGCARALKDVLLQT